MRAVPAGESWTTSTNLEAIGLSLSDSPAAIDYGKAASIAELQYAAGEHLALHAGAIVMALRLPKRGSTVLNIMRRLSRESWEQYRTTYNDAFCMAALLDLGTVRSVFRKERRWPELAVLLDHVFVMGGVYYCRAIRMSAEETEQFRERAATHLIEFQDDGERTAEHQIDRLMALEGLRKERIDKAKFIQAAIADASSLDPWALIRHHDRLRSEARRS
jgi:hypothetical protein